MSASTINPWKKSTPESSAAGGSQPQDLNDIMSSQLIQELEYKTFEESEVADTGAITSSVLSEKDQLAAFYAEAGLDSNGQPFPDETETSGDTDADLALALELQEHENQQNDAEMQRRAYQQSLDNQKGHVKIIDSDYYAESEMLAARGGCHRADLARLEEENDHHSKEVLRVQQQMQNKQTKKGVSMGVRVDRKNFATSEGVLDSRTRLMLFKLIQNGTLDRIHGVVKTGKEASVYCAEKGLAFDNAIPVTNRAHKGEAGVNKWWNRVGGDQDGDCMEREFVVLEDEEPEDEEVEAEEEGSAVNGAGLNSVDATAVKLALSTLPVLDINTRRFVPAGTETACSSSAAANSLDAAVEAARHQAQRLPCSPLPSTSSTVVIKIFRTTLNEFSNRRNYIYGDYRYFFTSRNKSLADREAANDRTVIAAGSDAGAGVVSSIPESELVTEFKHIHKKDVVNMWCEKEYRNLIRCYMGGIRVPCPYMFRQHMLIMACVPFSCPADIDSSSERGGGGEGLPALQLREFFKATPSTSVPTALQELKLLRRLLVDVVAAVHMMYHDAQLVHGDLSSYNVLCSGGRAVLIDFGQAVHIEHPKATELLEHDVHAIVSWFERMVTARLQLLQGRDLQGMQEHAQLKVSEEDLCSLVTTPLSYTLSNLEYVTVGAECSDDEEEEEEEEEGSDDEYEWVQPPRQEVEKCVTQVQPPAEPVASGRDQRRARRHREKQLALEHAVEARTRLENVLEGLLFNA